MAENSILILDHLSFSYGSTTVLSDFSLSIEKGSFTTLLGPSGCGKTTILRLMAGFLKPSSGRIFISGSDVTEVPVEQRRIGFVFQDFALFPHMTVRQNLLFGFGRRESKEHLIEMNDICNRLELSSLLDRYPYELSGGQQQRVALGRTLMVKPEIILMDEPLSSLDARLRVQVREDLLEIQKKIGITTIYVTHDQEEALSLSSDIAVISDGKLLQFDKPEKIYFQPADETAARFSGMTNFLMIDGKKIMVRPEWFSVQKESKVLSSESSFVSAEIVSKNFLGGFIRYKMKCQCSENGLLTVDIPAFSSSEKLNAGENVFLKINSSVCFD